MKRLKLLFIDTSAKLANVFVIEDGKLLAEGFDSGEKTHASMLIPVVDKALKDAGLGVSDIDVFAVTNGPGSYTGLRIAVACAKMLAYGAKKPLVPVNSLDFLAESAVSCACAAEAGKSIYVLPMMDARNTLCFYALYAAEKGGKLENLTGVQSDYTADIIEKVSGKQPLVICGDGSVKNREALLGGLGGIVFTKDKDVTGNYAGAWQAVIKKIGDGDTDALSEFSPEKASADYFKEVHITLRSGGNDH